MSRVSLLCVAALVLSRAAAPQTANPLLETALPIPFDRIKAEHVFPAVRQLLEEAKQQHEAYVAAADPLTFENTILALDEIGDGLERAEMIVRHLGGVVGSPEMRGALAQTVQMGTSFRSEMMLDPRVWAKINRYAGTKEAKLLTGNRKRLLELTLERYRREGAGLNEAARKRLRETSVELAKLGREFSDNALGSINAFELVIRDEAKLAGLPESARVAARQAARDKGIEGWRFTLQRPSFEALLAYMDDAAIREKVFRARDSAASAGRQDNRPVMRRILELRRERAKLLGYRTWADFQMETRMAGSGAKAQEFLATLESKTRAASQRENEELLAYRRKLEGRQAPPLAPWDTEYYAEKLRQERYALDSEALRAYFPFDSVLKGLFEIVGKLYGLKFAKLAGAPAWDPAVDYFEVRDVDGAVLGYFYTDFYTRSTKLPGPAWAGPLISRRASPVRPQVGVIVGKVTPPAGGRPALLRHFEVNILFHEFGHLLDMLLDRVPEPGLRRFVQDFVELPSQIMENFTWRRECLDLFARHYQTGERIPDELFKRMLAARSFGAARTQASLVAISTVDLALHTVYDPVRDPDPLNYARAIERRFGPVQWPLVIFTPLFAGGYSAGYYSYQWAQVLEADAFSRFEKEGVLNPKTGMEFRKKILERGNSADAAELFRDFMGRDPDPDAMLRRSGLLPAK